MSDTPPEHAPEPDADSAAGENGAPPPSAGGRRRAAVFVVTFLVTTFVLLTAFQFLSQTIWMQRYLFVVAEHTTMALDWVTDTTYLEFRDESDLPMERRGQIRAEIEAWRAGETPPNLPSEERDTGPPLTRWEWFQHRTLNEFEDTAAEEALAEELLAHPRPDGFDNPEQHIAFLEKRAELLERSIRRPQPDGSVREFADPEAVQLWREARNALDRVTEAPFVLTEESFQQLLAIDEALENAWQLQVVFTQRRLEHLHRVIINSGPLVHVVWRGGTRGELEEARLALARLNQGPDLDEAERRERTREKRVEIQGLEQQLTEQTRQGAPAEEVEGERFRFTVIPECGAIETMAIYIAAILGFPALWWKRLAGIVLGLPLLYAVNIVRLACLGLIGAWYEERVFDFAHHYVWQAIYLVFVVVVWLLWLELLVRRRGEKPSHSDA